MNIEDSSGRLQQAPIQRRRLHPTALERRECPPPTMAEAGTIPQVPLVVIESAGEE